MNRNFGVGILVLCFGFSNVNLGWADEAMQVAPVVAEPEDLGDINMQMLEQDRINRDQELAITGLIDDDQKLAARALAQKQDTTLEKINQTLIDYRNSLLSRDHARIVTASQRASKYYDLITLTEDVDDMKSARQTLQLRWDVIYGKHQLLNDLQEELMALNVELEQQAAHENPSGPAPQQEAKIQTLTHGLGEMDQKISGYDEAIAQKDQQISQLTGNLARVQAQVDLLKSELENKIAQENNQGQKDGIIKNQEEQIVQVSEKLDEKNDQVVLLKSELENKIAQGSEELKEQAQGYADEKDQVADLRNKIQQQIVDEKAKDESIRWLNQVLAVAKNKAKYYQLISQQDQMSITQVQGEVQRIREDFVRHFKDYDQFENAIISLKSKVSQLGWQLSRAKDQSQQDSQVQQGLKAQLQDKEAQIVKMKADILAILQDRANKEIYLHNAAVQRDDRINLAKELIDLQQQEAALLEEKSGLEEVQNAKFDQRFTFLENAIKGLLVNRQIQAADVQNRMEELKNELDQKQMQADMLKTELKNKITEEKNQDMLAEQVQGLKAQLKDKDDQIAATSSQSDQMNAMIGEYQKKLEAKSNAYNEELKQVLSAQNVQAQMEAQVVELNVKLQEKESQILNLKKDMYDMRQLISAKDKDAQANELNISMVQQKMVEKKINEYQAQINGLQAANTRQVQEITKLNTELAMVRKKLIERVPNIDEIDFLRTGFQKATMQLKQKDALILQIKANAEEYEREFKAQSREFQSLKEQLQDAQDELGRRNEDLKYKDMEITRLKVRTKMSGSDLQKEVMVLTEKLADAQKRLRSKYHNRKIEELQAQLMDAKAEIKDLHKQLDQFILPSKNNPLDEKLQQALDKIDQQGRIINTLVKRLQDCGQNVNLTKDTGK